jgi:hypothetical protein
MNRARFDMVSIRLAVSCAQTGSVTAAAREAFSKGEGWPHEEVMDCPGSRAQTSADADN